MARLLHVFSALQLDLPKGTKLGWQSLIQITGHDTYFSTKYKQENERNVVKFLLSEKNGISLVDMLVSARENARTTREIMPTEAFELINGLDGVLCATTEFLWLHICNDLCFHPLELSWN